MTYHTGPHSSSILTAAQNDGSGRARLPGPPVDYHTAARAARPSIASPPPSPAPRAPPPASKFPRRSARPGAGTGVILWLPLGPTQLRSHLVHNNIVASQTSHQFPGGALLLSTPSNGPRPGTAAPLPGTKGVPQVEHGSSTRPWEAPTGGLPAPLTSPLLGCPRVSWGNSDRKGAPPRGRPCVRTPASPHTPHHTARPYRRSA
ncbi:hypothetical protein NDU88_004496 [Pleurodeles waltl]|uniref:Uncharacterized protein n=1 Tax=Pleurodeles waltl TaxID=8319 RepID=A0AAV7QD75_PLEWA|nr:hypothetical protein NDU88_004496 [Pleurodeles waltl]